MHEKTKEIIALLESRYGTGRGWKTLAAKDLGISKTALSDVFSERYIPGKKLYDRIRTVIPNFVSQYEQLEDHEDKPYLQLRENNVEYVQSDSTFSVKVRDNALAGAGICDGDVVTIDFARQAKENDVVFVEINRELVIRLFRNGLLETVPPSGHRSESIIITPNIKVIGVVVSFTRILV